MKKIKKLLKINFLSIFLETKYKKNKLKNRRKFNKLFISSIILLPLTSLDIFKKNFLRKKIKFNNKVWILNQYD